MEETRDWSYAGRLHQLEGCDQGFSGAATGVPVHTSAGEVSTQLTRCSGGMCHCVCCHIPVVTVSSCSAAPCQSRPPAYRANTCSARLASSFSSLFPMCLVPCRSSALMALVTISQYRRGLCHDILIHKKSMIRALVDMIHFKLSNTHHLEYFNIKIIYSVTL